MLVIREEQHLQIGAAMRQRFVAEMRQRLDGRFPPSAETEPARLALIDAGIAHAATFEITGRHDVARFLDYFVRYGIAFGTTGETSWAGPVLRSLRLSGSQKMDRIDSVASAVTSRAPGAR